MHKITMLLIPLLLSTFVVEGQVTKCCAGELAYHFKTSIEGLYPKQSEGDVTVNGAQWRIDYKQNPDEVTDFDALIGSDSDIIAINGPTRTWFRLPSRARLALQSSLFTFGQDANVSDLRVAFANGGPQDVGFRVIFSYRIETNVSSEKIRGDVWGEIRVWTSKTDARQLPWRPDEISTGLKPVDDALSKALLASVGSVSQTQTEVSRRLEGGPVVRQLLTRIIGPLTPSVSRPGRFAVPANYRYQETILGVPGVAAPQNRP